MGHSPEESREEIRASLLQGAQGSNEIIFHLLTGAAITLLCPCKHSQAMSNMFPRPRSQCQLRSAMERLPCFLLLLRGFFISFDIWLACSGVARVALHNTLTLTRPCRMNEVKPTSH